MKYLKKKHTFLFLFLWEDYQLFFYFTLLWEVIWWTNHKNCMYGGFFLFLCLLFNEILETYFLCSEIFSSAVAWKIITGFWGNFFKENLEFLENCMKNIEKYRISEKFKKNIENIEI